MQRLQGIAVSPGVAIGEALVMGQEGFRIPRRFLPRDAVEDELDRLDRAIHAATAEIERNRDRVRDQLGDEYGAIFAAHIQMLNDRRLRAELDQHHEGLFPESVWLDLFQAVALTPRVVHDKWGRHVFVANR